MDSWQKLRRLTPQERIMLAQAAMLIPLISIGLRVLGRQRLMRWLDRLGRSAGRARPTEQLLDYARRAAYLTNAAAGRRFLQATCLQRSIALWWLLQREGIETRLVLGARKVQGEFQAHAWVEYEGEVLNDRPDVRARYAVFGGLRDEE